MFSLRIIKYIIVLIFACGCSSEINSMADSKLPETTSSYLPDGIYIRIIALASPFQSEDNTSTWMFDDYTAQDILKIISNLKPDGLERFITGKQDPNKEVPVDEGEAPMTVLEFLNAAIEAGSSDCIIIPKLNLKWNEEYFFEAAQNLYDLPLKKPIRNINLDCWPDYWQNHDENSIKQMLQKLKDIGFEVIGINMTGGYHEAYGYADYMDFNINTNTWTVNTNTLDKLKADTSLSKYFMYIDYPGAMSRFEANNSVDEQADILKYNIFPYQEIDRFTFVYPILQDDWDATQVFTSSTGSYAGISIFEVIKNLIIETRNNLHSSQ
jgi:hypothetical protein